MLNNETEKNIETNTFQLPASFLYGAASSSHQVEGNNILNDWWQQEILGKLPKSGQATDHYNLFEEDFGLAKQIGLNAMRISIEWSRIQPIADEWDMSAVEHYRAVLREMKAQGLTRMVTLHHYTLPVWLADKGGFASSQIVKAFGNYAEFIAQELGHEIDLWCTVNEPEVFTYMTSLRGMWPPFSKNPLRAYKVFSNMAKAHNLAFRKIKAILPQSKIGMAKNNVYNEAYRPKSFLDTSAVKLNNWFSNNWFLNKIRRNLDFIGLNYYFYHTLTVNSHGIVQHNNVAGPKSDMGWRTYPQGIFHLIMDLHERYNLPIYITENGIANAHDDMRQDFIRQHLYWVSRAISKGAQVRGYFYWSLTDTYEWQDGFDPKFGLIEIDFQNLKRTIRPSAAIFKTIQNQNN